MPYNGCKLNSAVRREVRSGRVPIRSIAEQERRSNMPLTRKGRKVMAAMKKSYGAKKGKAVFYASANAGTISGVHKKRKK
jgi:hypothetical protein